MSVSVIDSHHHLWDLNRFQYNWMPPAPNPLHRDYLPRDFEPLLKKNGVSRTIVIQAHHSTEESKFLLDLSENVDFIGGVVVWVDLTRPGVGKLLDQFMKRAKFVGVRHMLESEEDDSWVIREDVVSGLREVANRGLTYDLLVRPHHLPYIPILAERLPELRMVIDHISKPPVVDGSIEPWASAIADVSTIPGIHCKLSGMVTEADHRRWSVEDLVPYVNHVVEIFGFDRLMWGSDWPVCLLAATYQRVIESALAAVGPVSSADYGKLMGLNAVNFYQLKPPV